MQKFILIDGNALVHRAFHALPALSTAKGLIVNAVFGFASILIKTIKDFKPEYIAAAFDLPGPTIRHQQFEGYKIHRVKAPDELYQQIPIIKEMLAAFGIPVFEKESYEADDIIGTIATQTQAQEDLQTIIVTGDLDTLQLIQGDQVVVFTLRKGMTDTIVYDQKAVLERFGISPKQLSDFKGLKGDPSDNIPGVPGVGEKTAIELIKKFGSLEELYNFLEGQKQKTKTGKPLEKQNTISQKLAEKLLENKDQAFFSKQLARIITDLDINFSLAQADWRKKSDPQKISVIFKDLAFFSLLKRLSDISLSNQEELPALANFQESKAAPKLTSNLETFFASGSSEKLNGQILENSRQTIVGHGLKEIIKPWLKKGIRIKCRLFDTQIAAYLINPDLQNYDFDKIYYSEFHQNLNKNTPLATYLDHLKNHLQKKLKSASLTKVFEEIEMPLIPVLAEMELAGVKIDIRRLATLLKFVNKEITSLEAKIFKLAGKDFNINSPQQLGQILFQKLALKGRVRKTTKGALSTAAPELEKLREEHPIIDLILDFRELQKLKTTYIEPFPKLIDSADGRLHTTYNQTGTATGRLSSENPNLQNIPVRTGLGQKFRQAFIAENGYQLTSFDYSQIELRVVAHLAEDKKMIQAFQAGEDIHTRTAVEIFGVKPDFVTLTMRRQAKVLNFGVIYGMGPAAFARSAGIKKAEAQDFISRYFAEFSGVAKYMEDTKNKARRLGYVETFFGRRRPILDIHSTMPQVQAQAERMAINSPAQGTSADIVKIAMNQIYDKICQKFGRDEVKMLMQVHDELVFEIKDQAVKKAAGEIKKIMENTVKLKVPLVVEVKTGGNWANLKSLN